jgi:Predicted membrane protein
MVAVVRGLREALGSALTCGSDRAGQFGAVSLAFWEHRAARHEHPRLVAAVADPCVGVAARGGAAPGGGDGQLRHSPLGGRPDRLLGTLLIWPLKLVLGPAWAITSLGGLIAPVSFLFNWLITIVLFAIAAWLINGFRLKHGLFSAILGAVVYSVISAFVPRALGLVDVEATRAALITG